MSAFLKSSPVLAALLLLSGCVTTRDFFPPSGTALTGMQPAQIPEHGVGDKVYFSNGRREWVIAEKGDDVVWRRTGNRTYTRSSNFLIPDREWESETRLSKHLMDLDPELLWPLKRGNEARYRVQVSYLDKATGSQSFYDRVWDCEVDGAETLSVFAGTFDTYRITCKRYSLKGRMYQRRVWHYAPEIGHFVSRWDDYAGKRTSSLEMTAYQPFVNGMDREWQQGYWKNLRMALEKNLAGRAQSWSDKAAGTKVTITPVRTMKTANGIYCRNYRVDIVMKGKGRKGAGLACRDGKGYWKIPKSIRPDRGVKF